MEGERQVIYLYMYVYCVCVYQVGGGAGKIQSHIGRAADMFWRGPGESGGLNRDVQAGGWGRVNANGLGHERWQEVSWHGNIIRVSRTSICVVWLVHRVLSEEKQKEK